MAAAKGMSHSYGRNRRGKWVLSDQPEEDLGQPQKPKSATRPRSTKASYVSPVAQPSSPAASWESGAAQQARTRRQQKAGQDDFPEVPSRYSLQVHCLPPLHLSCHTPFCGVLTCFCLLHACFAHVITRVRCQHVACVVDAQIGMPCPVWQKC